MGWLPSTCWMLRGGTCFPRLASIPSTMFQGLFIVMFNVVFVMEMQQSEALLGQYRYGPALVVVLKVVSRRKRSVRIPSRL